MRSLVMKNLVVLLVALLGIISVPAFGQKEKKRPPKQENVVTPDDGKDKAAANRAQKEAEYRDKKEYHKNLQDKSTQKRMKQTYKKAQKHSIGREVPFYKRWFRRKRI